MKKMGNNKNGDCLCIFLHIYQNFALSVPNIFSLFFKLLKSTGLKYVPHFNTQMKSLLGDVL